MSVLVQFYLNLRSVRTMIGCRHQRLVEFSLSIKWIRCNGSTLKRAKRGRRYVLVFYSNTHVSSFIVKVEKPRKKFLFTERKNQLKFKKKKLFNGKIFVRISSLIFQVLTNLFLVEIFRSKQAYENFRGRRIRFTVDLEENVKNLFSIPRM